MEIKRDPKKCYQHIKDEIKDISVLEKDFPSNKPKVCVFFSNYIIQLLLKGRDNMNQEKIGKFIAEKRKDRELTQEQLADKLNISKNAVSKWERGLNLPNVSIMQELCKILGITLNELFIGENIIDEKYKEVADNNLLNALENSSFTLKEKIEFYKKKWRKEHISKMVLCFISWIVLIIVLKFKNVESYIIGTIAVMLSVLFYIVLYNQMMIYVENNAYKKTEK